MKNNKKKDTEINELSEFVFDVQNSIKDNDLFEIPYMIKYQLSDEISSTYDIIDENSLLEGISN